MCICSFHVSSMCSCLPGDDRIHAEFGHIPGGRYFRFKGLWKINIILRILYDLLISTAGSFYFLAHVRSPF